MTDADRTPMPLAGGEIATTLGALDRIRATFAWKCGGLDADGMKATTASSSMTLGGLLKHVALVEDEYFTHRLLGREMPEPWRSVDWDADPDWEWRTGAADPPDDVMKVWRDAVARSRAAVSQALEAGGMDQHAQWSSSTGESPNLRRILADMIEEYARHTGHADILRESVDGLTGEDAGS